MAAASPSPSDPAPLTAGPSARRQGGPGAEHPPAHGHGRAGRVRPGPEGAGRAGPAGLERGVSGGSPPPHTLLPSRSAPGGWVTEPPPPWRERVRRAAERERGRGREGERESLSPRSFPSNARAARPSSLGKYISLSKGGRHGLSGGPESVQG